MWTLVNPRLTSHYPRCLSATLLGGRAATLFSGSFADMKSFFAWLQSSAVMECCFLSASLLESVISCIYTIYKQTPPHLWASLLLLAKHMKLWSSAAATKLNNKYTTYKMQSHRCVIPSTVTCYVRSEQAQSCVNYSSSLEVCLWVWITAAIFTNNYGNPLSFIKTSAVNLSLWLSNRYLRSSRDEEEQAWDFPTCCSYKSRKRSGSRYPRRLDGSFLVKIKTKNPRKDV